MMGFDEGVIQLGCEPLTKRTQQGNQAVTATDIASLLLNVKICVSFLQLWTDLSCRLQLHS
jgi:hypothetical protein